MHAVDIPYKKNDKLATSSIVLTGATVLTSGFTDGAGQIWLDNVQCSGTETRLIDCPANPLGQHNCAHSQDAGVSCTDLVATCPQGAIRLQDGVSNTTGRVEICNNNVWGTVCNDLWGPADAQVACAQLGLPSTGTNCNSWWHGSIVVPAV